MTPVSPTIPNERPMAMKHVFLINPAAGKFDHTTVFSAAIREVFSNRPGEEVEILVSDGPGHCRELARLSCQSGEPVRLYACGGDGTLNEVVCGAAGFPNAAVTHYPGGSGNDFIKIFRDPSAFRDLAALVDGAETEFDLIQAGPHRYALNICSIGFDARVGTEVGYYRRLPLVSGAGAYNLSVIANVIKGLHQHYVLQVDGQSIDARQTLICIANGRWYGGGFNPVPEAEPDDGLLDLLLVRDVSRLTVAKVIGQYKKGLHRQLPHIITHRRCKTITVRCEGPSAVNVDGELMTEQTVTFSVAPEKIRFFYPKGQVWSARV